MTASPTGLRGALATSARPAADPGAGSDGSDGLMAGGDPAWARWWAQVCTVQAEIAKLDDRISAINAKTYQDINTLSRSPSSLHQPLLQTFDRAKTTQELKDGAAVTAAFGMAAYKRAGDEADVEQRDAQKLCDSGNAAGCDDARRWGEGGAYRTALHMTIGAMSAGSQGALGNLTGTLAVTLAGQALQQLNVTDANAVNLIKNLATTVAAAGVSGASGAAAAFTADANNRMMHTRRFELLVAACAAGKANSTSVDCTGIAKLAGVRSDPVGSRIEGLPGLLIRKNWDESGSVVGAFLVDSTTGDHRYVMDLVDLQKLMTLPKEERLSYVRLSEATTMGGLPFCNPISFLCGSGGNGMSRGNMEGIHAYLDGKYTTIYPGNAVRLDQFIFKTAYPEVGDPPRSMEVDWQKMAAKFGTSMLLLGDYFGRPNDATKFGSILVTRTGPNTVQIAPKNFDFDLNKSIVETLGDTLKVGPKNREMLTLIGGLLAGGFSTRTGGSTFNYGLGRPVTVVFDGKTYLPPKP